MSVVPTAPRSLKHRHVRIQCQCVKLQIAGRLHRRERLFAIQQRFEFPIKRGIEFGLRGHGFFWMLSQGKYDRGMLQEGCNGEEAATP